MLQSDCIVALSIHEYQESAGIRRIAENVQQIGIIELFLCC